MQPLEHASPLVAITLFGWIPFVLTLFALLPSRKAVVTAFLAAWLFLPVYGYEIKFFPEYTKISATCMGVFCATLIFDPERFLRFRPKWIDVPVTVYMMAPFVSSMTNGLGPYDGLSESFARVVGWGLPYFIGRMYFNDARSMRMLVFGVVVGGLIYVPLCWYEIRFSPQLHRLVYGLHQHSFVQTYRFGGWRPTVFLNHGLMVGMWMATASLCAFWLWQSRAVTRIWGIPMAVCVAVLIVTTVFCKSAAAIFLMIVGCGALLLIRWSRTSLPVLGLAAVSVIYIVLRASGAWDAQLLVDVADKTVGAERAGSLETRFFHETKLMERARERILFGWGGWGRSRIQDDSGEDVSITDSAWVIQFGVTGLLGLSALLALLLLPPLFLRTRIPPALWAHPAGCGAAVAAVIVCLWMLDNCMNAMMNPIYIVTTGGLSGIERLSLETIGHRARPMQPARESAPWTGAAAVRMAQRRMAAKRPARESDS